MAIPSDLMRPRVFVAQSRVEHKQTRRMRGERRRIIDFRIHASRSLSEEPSIINCCKEGIELTDHFFVTFRAASHSEPAVAGEESRILSVYALTKPIIRDVSRRST